MLEYIMVDLGKHGSFILASYGVTLLILGGLVVTSLRAYSSAKARLAASERDGA
jgi:heme exporter protein CcmD